MAFFVTRRYKNIKGWFLSGWFRSVTKQRSLSNLLFWLIWSKLALFWCYMYYENFASIYMIIWILYHWNNSVKRAKGAENVLGHALFKPRHFQPRPSRPPPITMAYHWKNLKICLGYWRGKDDPSIGKRKRVLRNDVWWIHRHFQEQLSLCVRFMDSGHSIKEDFLRFSWTKSTTLKAILLWQKVKMHYWGCSSPCRTAEDKRIIALVTCLVESQVLQPKFLLFRLKSKLSTVKVIHWVWLWKIFFQLAKC